MATTILEEYKKLVIKYLSVVARYHPKMVYQERLLAAKIFARLDLEKKYPDIIIQL